MSHFKDPIQRRSFLGTILASASVGVAGLALPLQLGAAEERALPAPGSSRVLNPSEDPSGYPRRWSLSPGPGQAARGENFPSVGLLIPDLYIQT